MSQYPPGQQPYGQGGYGQPPYGQYPPGQDQYPPGQYPAYHVPGYATPGVPVAPPRPTSVTVLAIIGIVLGGLATLCSPIALVPFLVDMPGPKDPVIGAMKQDAGVKAWMVGSAAFGWVMAVVLLVASIAALSLKRWARTTLLAYALIAIVSNVVGLFVALLVVNPKVASLVGDDPAARAAMGMQTVITVAGSVVGLIFPGFLLFFMTRPHVKAAFSGLPPPAAEGYAPGAYPGYPPPGGYPQ